MSLVFGQEEAKALKETCGETLIIPDGYTEIEGGGYWSLGYRNIVIAKTVKKIHRGACSAFKKAYIPRSVSEIGESAFDHADVYLEGTVNKKWTNRTTYEMSDSYAFDYHRGGSSSDVVSKMVTISWQSGCRIHKNVSREKFMEILESEKKD